MAWILRLRQAAAAAHERWPRPYLLSFFALLHERLAPGREAALPERESRG